MRMLLVCVLLALTLANPAQDLVTPANITALFNISINEALYSGYLPVSNISNIQFHYFFALRNDSLPVTLWLNGGPGCSSAQGLFNENGPFNFLHNSSTVVNNHYSWSNVTNMLFIESPVGVGFSFGPVQNQTDESTAAYNLLAVIQFYLKFPQFASKDFYISGESYAGIYIPTLASKILDYNLLASTTIPIPLKGLMIGNGCTDPSECSEAAGVWTPHIFSYYAGHNLISQATYKLVLDNADACYGSFSDACEAIVEKVDVEFQGNHNLNPYDVYGDCLSYKKTTNTNELKGSSKQRSAIHYLKNPNLRDNDLPPCTDGVGLYTWLSLSAAFKTAFHVDPVLSPTWDICADINYEGDVRATYYLYPKLIKAGLRIWKYSGDADAVVPITGTLFWINKLQNQYNLRTLVQWRPWYMNGDLDVKRQNAGNYWKLDGLTFVSIKGAGHMVPTDKRHAALDLFTAFIADADLPSV